VERERGFGEAVRTIKQMAIRLGATLDVLVIERERSHMNTHFSRVKPFPPTEFHSVATDALFEGDADQPNGAPDNEDLIVLLGAREGRLAWTPAMSELPLKLSARYPGVNLVIFHPPENDIEPAAASGPASLLDPARVFPDLPPLSFDGAMEHMLAQRFPDAMHRRSILDQLSRMIQEYPVEMAPGIIMVHAHVDHIPYPLLFVGSSRNGFFMPIETQQPARVLVILLSPTNLPAEEHLRSLALIARMLRGPGRAERISRATTFDELRDELMQEK
jgi:mannitol/fructose-specific phosphotransferase system IIA component (Ntr-type)